MYYTYCTTCLSRRIMLYPIRLSVGLNGNPPPKKDSGYTGISWVMSKMWGSYNGPSCPYEYLFEHILRSQSELIVNSIVIINAEYWGSPWLLPVEATTPSKSCNAFLAPLWYRTFPSLQQLFAVLIWHWSLLPFNLFAFIWNATKEASKQCFFTELSSVKRTSIWHSASLAFLFEDGVSITPSLIVQ